MRQRVGPAPRFLHAEPHRLGDLQRIGPQFIAEKSPEPAPQCQWLVIVYMVPNAGVHLDVDPQLFTQLANSGLLLRFSDLDGTAWQAHFAGRHDFWTTPDMQPPAIAPAAADDHAVYAAVAMDRAGHSCEYSQPFARRLMMVYPLNYILRPIQ